MASTVSLAHSALTALAVRTKNQSPAPTDGRDSVLDRALRNLLARAASMVIHAQKEPPPLNGVDQELTLQLAPVLVQSALKAGIAQEEKDLRESAPPVTSPLAPESPTVTHAPLDSHALTTQTSHCSP